MGLNSPFPLPSPAVVSFHHVEGDGKGKKRCTYYGTAAPAVAKDYGDGWTGEDPGSREKTEGSWIPSICLSIHPSLQVHPYPSISVSPPSGRRAIPIHRASDEEVLFLFPLENSTRCFLGGKGRSLRERYFLGEFCKCLYTRRE